MRGFRSARTDASLDSDIYLRGPVDTVTILYAQAEVARAARSGPLVHHVRTKIAEYGGEGQPPLCVAQVNLDVDGRLIRRQAVAPSIVLAVDRITAALPAVLDEIVRYLARPAGPPSFAGHQWQHHRLARPVPTYARPHRQPRRLARHKTFPLAVQNAASAALTMDLRDYDFYPYTDDHDGLDRVVYRAAPTGYRITTLTGAATPGQDTGSPAETDSGPMPSLTLPQAIRRLDTGNRAFLIFAGAAVRAAILYRRYDGHLGLVTPHQMSRGPVLSHPIDQRRR